MAFVKKIPFICCMYKYENERNVTGEFGGDETPKIKSQNLGCD